MGDIIFAFGDSSKEVKLEDINSVEDVASNMKEVMKEELHQEEINHPEKTVYQRAFIKNFDDQAGYRDSFRLNAYGYPFFIAHTEG